MKGSKTGGRRKGTQNKATREAKAFCASIIESPRYQRQLRERVDKGTLPPALEAMLWHYAYGVPKQRVEVDGPASPIFALSCLPALSPDPALERDGD